MFAILNYSEMRWYFNIFHDIPPKILYHVKYEKGDCHADKDRRLELVNKENKTVTVKDLETFLSTVKDKSKSVYFYNVDDNPFDCGIGVENAFEVSRDASCQGTYEGVYLKGN